MTIWKWREKKIRWEKPDAIKTESFGDLIWGAVWESFAIVLLLFASLSMCTVAAKQVRIGLLGGWKLFMTVIGAVFFREVCLRYAVQYVQGILSKQENAEKREKNEDRIPLLLTIGKAVVILALFWCFWGYGRAHAAELKGGLLAIVQQYLDAYNRMFHANIVVMGALEKWISDTLFFGVLALFFVFYLLSDMGERKTLFLFFPLLSVSALMAVGLTPEWEQVVLAGTGLFMLCHGAGRKRARRSVLVTLVLFLAVTVLSGALLEKQARGLLTHAPQAKAVERRLESRLETLFSAGLIFGDPRVSNSSPRYKDAEVMTIRTDEQPQGNSYFWNFHGARYDHGTWISADQTFEDACREHGMEAKEAAAYLSGSVSALFKEVWKRQTMISSYYDPSGVQRTDHQMQFEMQYKGVFNGSALLSYGADTRELQGVNCRGDYVAGKSWTQKKLYMEAWDSQSFATNLIIVANRFGGERTQEEKAFWDWYDAYVRATYLDIPSELADSGALASEAFPYPYKASFTYDDAEKLPDNEERLLLAGLIQKMLQGPSSTYSWDLDKLDAGVDPVIYFLEHDRKGYCMHFASAGVLLLRNLRVPARYTAGYVVPQSGFRKTEEGSFRADVIDRNGHAWVEIYLDGIGWMPVEMTPGYGGSSEELPTSKEAQEKRKKAAAEEKTPASEEEGQSAPDESAAESASSQASDMEAEQESSEHAASEEESSSENEESQAKEASDTKEDAGDKKAGAGDPFGRGNAADGEGEGFRSGKGFHIILRGVLLLVVMTLLALVIGQAVRKRQKRLEDMISRQYYKGAVRIMHQRVYRKLRLGRKIRRDFARGGALTDQDLEEALRRVLGEERDAVIAEYMRVVKKAAFSCKNLSEQEYKAVRKVYRMIKK